MEEKIQIGKIKKVPLREIWKKEDKNFTTWLQNHIDYLNDIFDFDLEIVKKDKEVGTFKVDLYAEDNQGNKVIIENQLEKTDHDHLGKVITYLTNLDAKAAIWITSRPRDEHIKAIEWLNEISPKDIAFYLVKVEALRIADQPKVGPQFTIVKGPTLESKQIGADRKEFAERHFLREEFWTKLLEKTKEKTDLHSNVSPSKYSYIAAGAGKAGITYIYEITQKYGRVEVYLDKGKEDESVKLNKIRFDQLAKHKKEIEEEFGNQLDWEKLEDRKASRISYTFKGAGLKNKDKWDSLQNKMIEAMVRLERATKRHIKRLD